MYTLPRIGKEAGRTTQTSVSTAPRRRRGRAGLAKSPLPGRVASDFTSSSGGHIFLGSFICSKVLLALTCPSAVAQVASKSPPQLVVRGLNLVPYAAFLFRLTAAGVPLLILNYLVQAS